MARYGVSLALGGGLWGTLCCNLAGSFLLAALFAAAAAGGRWPQWAVTAAGTGFVGAFTTFSTFCLEGQVLLAAGRMGAFLLYGGGSLALGLAAALVGRALGRRLAGKGAGA